MAYCTAADLGAPYTAMAGAAAACLAASSEIRGAISSSPYRYSAPDDLTGFGTELAAEVNSWGVALAKALLTRGGRGQPQEVLKDAAMARAQLARIREGDRRLSGLSATTGSAGLGVIGTRTLAMTDARWDSLRRPA